MTRDLSEQRRQVELLRQIDADVCRMLPFLARRIVLPAHMRQDDGV